MSVINTNVQSLVANAAIQRNNRELSLSMQQLSTGKRINSASDDAAGLAISSRMTATIRGLDQAVRNANDGISLIQTAEGALVEVTNMVQRMRELAVQSANDTNTDQDRSYLNLEFQQLKAEINRIANSTEWNGMKILNRETDNDGIFAFQVGAKANQKISVQIPSFTTSADSVAPPVSTGTIGVTSGQLGSVGSMKGFELTGDFYGSTVTFSEGGIGSISITVPDLDSWNSSTSAHGGNAVHYIAQQLTLDSRFNNEFNISAVTDYNNVNNGLLRIESSSSNTIGNNVQFSISRKPGYQPEIVETVYSMGRESSQVEITGAFNQGDVLSVIAYGIETQYVVTRGDLFSENVNEEIYRNLTNQINSQGIDGLTVSTDGSRINLLGRSDYSPIGVSVEVVRNTNPPPITGGMLAEIDNDNLLDAESSNSAIEDLDIALDAIAGGRAYLGAIINRLTYAADNLTNVSTNTTASRSRILDADYAKATTDLAKAQIIAQAANAMLAQANQNPQSVIQLLQR